MNSADSSGICLVVGSADETEEIYRVKYEKVRGLLESISNILRSVNSLKVPIPAFCDMLMMYAHTETYFTQSENFHKCRSDEVIIRRCDVRHASGSAMDKFS